MDDMTDEEFSTLIRKFVAGEDGRYPELADLPTRWDSIPPAARTLDLPNYLARDVLIWSYSNFAFTKRWAWDGLHRLSVTLEERREPIPSSLLEFAHQVWTGSRTRPRKQPGKSPYAAKDDRDFRIMYLVGVLRKGGLSREKAIANVAEGLGLPEETVISVVRKIEHFHPFRRTIAGK